MPPFDPDEYRSAGQRELWLSFLFVCLAGVVFVLPQRAQEQVAGVLRSTVLAPFVLVQESIHQARVRASDITQLQEALDAAVATLAAQRTLGDENARLRALLDLRERAGPHFLSATVIRSGTRGSESMFLLDVGTNDGVEVWDPVVVAEGLVGVIREAGARTSVAMDWTHPDFRVSAMSLDGEAFGQVEPRPGAFREEDRLLLDGVPYYTSLERGTAVVTSGQGSVYPRGILVGVVDDLAEAEAGWRRGYWLIPAVRPAAVTHVLIMTGEEGRPAADVLELWVPPVPGPELDLDSVMEPEPDPDPPSGTDPPGRELP